MASIDLRPATLDIVGIRSGDRNELTLILSEKGAPLDLTGKTLAAQARKAVSDDSVSLTAVITITDAAAGKFTMRWPGDAVRDIVGTEASWKGVWDLQLGAEGDDSAQTILAGSITLDNDVTRDS